MMSQTFAAILVASVVCSATAAGAGRSLLQGASSPPNPDFGGPATVISPSLAPPAGSTVKINWHSVGTQNYTSTASSTYKLLGAMADFFLQNGTTVVGQHFFLSNGAGGFNPVFTKTDASGNVQGTVVAMPIANQTAPAQNDDGGFGSVPYLLLQALSADGFFEGVTFVQRINTLGGEVPTGMFPLPASPTGIPDMLLDIPYQADYLFFVGPPAASPASG